MKRFITYTAISLFTLQAARSQDNIYPAAKQTQTIALTNAVIHTGTGKVINNGTLIFENGLITFVGETKDGPVMSNPVDLKGQHIYPGLINAGGGLGLSEIESVRSTRDNTELGTLNPSVRSIIAYNTDSRIINTLRSNGILLSMVVPQGGLISGSSSVVQLDAWNWEDAAYQTDNGIHINMPSLEIRSNPFGPGRQPTDADPLKQAQENIAMIKQFFREAAAWIKEAKHGQENLKYDAVRGLFEQKQQLFVHCNGIKEMLSAIDFQKEFGFRVVIVGGSESWQIAGLLKENNIPVIFIQTHSLPSMADDDVDQPFKTPALLQKAGVLFCIANGATWQQRNLPFQAGTAASYGLSREEALAAISSNAAKILRIDNRTGTLEEGKDANILVSQGDLLDMKTSIITQAYIQGRTINLSNKQTQLFERYKQKYGFF